MDGTGDSGYLTWNLRGRTSQDANTGADPPVQSPRTVHVIRRPRSTDAPGAGASCSPTRMAESLYGTGRRFPMSQPGIQIMQIPDGQAVRVVSGDGQGHGDHVHVIHCTPGARQHMQEQQQSSRTPQRVRVVSKDPCVGYQGVRILSGGQGIRILQGDTKQGVKVVGDSSLQRGYRGSPETVRIIQGPPGGQKVQYVRQLSHHQPEEQYSGAQVRIMQSDPDKCIRILPVSRGQSFEINSQGIFVKDGDQHSTYHSSDSDRLVIDEAALSMPPDMLRHTRPRLQDRNSESLAETMPTSPARTQSRISFHLQPQRRNSHGGEEMFYRDSKDASMLVRGRPYTRQKSDTACGQRRGGQGDIDAWAEMASQRPADRVCRQVSHGEIPSGGGTRRSKATVTVQDGDSTARTVQESRETAAPGDSSYSSPSGSAEPNFFNKFQFCFGSFGNFGRMNSQDRGRQVFFFNNFDDMMGRIGDLVGRRAKGPPTREQHNTCGR